MKKKTLFKGTRQHFVVDLSLRLNYSPCDVNCVAEEEWDKSIHKNIYGLHIPGVPDLNPSRKCSSKRHVILTSLSIIQFSFIVWDLSC